MCDKFIPTRLSYPECYAAFHPGPMRKIRMRIFHIGQHHEFYNAEDIYDLCFALALVSTASSRWGPFVPTSAY